MAAEFRSLLNRAISAGLAAGSAVTPTPMVVVERANPLDDSSRITRAYEPVMDGVCGFAWIRIAGNTAFGRWAKKEGSFSKAYPTGLWYWVGEFNQSLTRKEAFASAFAKVLRDAGIEAYSGSRMD